MLILGIESSCDETAGAVCRDGEIISNVVLSQVIHKQYGGVVPEIASREHDSQITSIIQKTLDKANVKISDIQAIAVTYGAGLMGALLVGLNYAKGLSIALKIPFIGVNHLEGHLYASFISFPDMKYPYLCLLVTGGHTQIWEVQSPGNYFLHSTTIDDAAGEAFDKGARILGLAYPGGPEIEKIAQHGDTEKYNFPIPKVKNNPLNFSFSGLKTALLYKYRELSQDEIESHKKDIAASYQEAILNTLFRQLDNVITLTEITQISIVGGVAANKRFREKADLLKDNSNIHIYFPTAEYCTDNAAMIAVAGYEKLKERVYSPLTLKVNPNLALNDGAVG
ncbi:MAG: tRNA (adenosine(37)-N6)-threonylcarbamoyltransferase complex transferase subunit TsaD [Candidatus Marinimicrobia bacterium]|nr:tRNA (adenosine(37)-N6)-threonylcarbamoyltransferase complex transferase subunit TsaD [Candidatus Neomarinimicrobiota bacterium]